MQKPPSLPSPSSQAINRLRRPGGQEKPGRASKCLGFPPQCLQAKQSPNNPAEAGSEAVTIGTGLRSSAPQKLGVRFAPGSRPTRHAHPGGHRQTPTPLPTLLQPPRSGSPLARRTSVPSTWSSGALPRPPGPSSSPELIPATDGPPALREIQARPPGLHPPPLSPPSHPVGPAPAEAETRQVAAGRGRERLAPRLADAPPARSVPEGGSPSTSPAPPLHFRPARPQPPCARVPGSTRPLAGDYHQSCARTRARSDVASRRPACPGCDQRGLFLAHPRRAGARPRSA